MHSMWPAPPDTFHIGEIMQTHLTSADNLIASNLGLLMIENARLAARVDGLVSELSTVKAENTQLKADNAQLAQLAAEAANQKSSGTVYDKDQG